MEASLIIKQTYCQRVRHLKDSPTHKARQGKLLVLESFRVFFFRRGLFIGLKAGNLL